MHGYLRQNTATSRPFGPFVEASDGYSYKATTITLSASNVVIWKADGSVTQLVTSAALQLPNPGWALLPIAASDVTSCGVVRYAIGNASGNLPVWREYMVIPANVYDSYVLGTDFLQVDVVQVTGAAPSAAQVNANVQSIAAGVGVNVSSINAGVGVHVSSSITVNANVLTITGAAPSAAFAGYVIPVNMTQLNGAAPSTGLPDYLLSHVMYTPGVQTITLKDTVKVIAAAVAGKCTGATGAAMVFRDPNGTARVSGTLVSGNRGTVTWATG